MSTILRRENALKWKNVSSKDEVKGPLEAATDDVVTIRVILLTAVVDYAVIVIA